MKQKGFTLIELLAVIVILAIIAVIAIPQIVNMVDEAKAKAAVSSAYGYIDAVEKRAMILATKNNNSIPNGKYENLTEFNNEYKVDVSGRNVTKGFLVLEKNEVKNAEFNINGYKVVCNNQKCVAKDINMLIEIIVEQQPTKTTYNLFENLDLSGLVIKAKYSKGNTKVIDSNLTYEPVNGTKLSEEGEAMVTISYTEEDITKSVTIPITVIDPYAANRVSLTINKDTSKGGTITEENGVYTLQGQALLKSSETISLAKGTFYVEVKGISRYYNGSQTPATASLLIGTGIGGSGTQSSCFGISDGWGVEVINGFTGSGGYPNFSKSLLTNEWNRFAVTYDGSTFKLYLNGEVKGTYNSASIKNTILYVGGYLNAPYSSAGNEWGFANGQYRNIKVYNVALPASAL